MAVREVERLGAALACQSGQDENSAMLANRVPDFAAPAIDGR